MTKKEKVKKWFKEHKILIGYCAGAAIYGVTIYKIGYEHGCSIGYDIASENSNKCTKVLLKTIAPEVNKFYIIQRTGDFRGKTISEFDSFYDIVKTSVNVINKDNKEA